MATVNFLYRSTKSKAPLNLRLLYRHEGKDFVIGEKIKLEVTAEYWNKHHTQERPRDIEIKNKQVEVNGELANIERHILTAFDLSPIDRINKEWLQQQIEDYYNPRPATDKHIPLSLIDYIDYYIEARKHEIKETSIKKYYVIKHKLIKFEKHRRQPILFTDINEGFKFELIEWQKNNGYNHNTIQREIASIKTFCRHARYMGIEIHPQFEGLKLERKRADKVYLTEQELKIIADYQFKQDYLDNARDWLLISCYTGQRISDFLRFDKTMIRTQGQKQFIEFTQQKTGKIMSVPIVPIVADILKKRNGNFPRQISDQRYNEYLKEVCKLAGINEVMQGSKQEVTDHGRRKVKGDFEKWELVSSHIGRRSFATNFYGKIPVTYLTAITGHSSEQMFLEYIGKSQSDLANEFLNYFN